MNRPKPGDYGDIYENYIKSIKGTNGIELLETQFTELRNLLKDVDEDKANYTYETGKWTLKEVVGHLLDTERIFAYRALSIARNEKKSLPGMDQNDYVLEGNFNHYKLNELMEDYRIQKKSTIRLFVSFDEDMLQRKGVANNCPVTTLALLLIILGHERHHINVLKERYGL